MTRAYVTLSPFHSQELLREIGVRIGIEFSFSTPIPTPTPTPKKPSLFAIFFFSRHHRDAGDVISFFQINAFDAHGGTRLRVAYLQY